MGQSSSVGPILEPSPPGALQQFLKGQDLAQLEETPLVFEKTHRVNRYNCCVNCAVGLASAGLTCVFCPVGVLCPGKLFPYYSLKLDSQAVQVHSVYNDFCCHLQQTVKTLPLEKVQDIQITQNCLHACFGVHQVSVQTAGNSNPDAGAELSAVFLAAPLGAREALQLAVRLNRQHQGSAAAPLQQAGMARGGGSGGGELAARLSALDVLVQRGALTAPEARAAKVGVLASAADPLPSLLEASQLAERGVISADEFQTLKAALLAQIAQVVGRAV